MTNPLIVGQTMTIDGFPVQIIAIAAHYDIQDILVIMGKSDITGYVITETDKRGISAVNTAYFANAEDSSLSYVERAFGINT